MKLQEIYALAVSLGAEHDARGCGLAMKELEKACKAFEALAPEEREFFDPDKLQNPYGDTRILYGDPELEVKKILAGIDMEIGELLLADRLNERGAAIDLVLAHHPEGRALLNLAEVMRLQPGVLSNFGVQLNVAEALMEDRAKEVDISVGVTNYQRSVDAARLLDLPMLCVHTPCDNLVVDFLSKLMEKERPETVGDILKLLKTIPEYAAACRSNNPPQVVSGAEHRSAGRVFVDMTGGTGGPKEYYKLVGDAHVGTVLCMHAGKEILEVARENHLNVVIAGHMPSDCLGVNLFLDRLQARGVEILTCSGLTRIERLRQE